MNRTQIKTKQYFLNKKEKFYYEKVNQKKIINIHYIKNKNNIDKNTVPIVISSLLDFNLNNSNIQYKHAEMSIVMKKAVPGIETPNKDNIQTNMPLMINPKDIFLANIIFLQ